MNRIQFLLKNKKKNIISFFVTAGFPKLKDTVRIISQLEQKGIDMVEIGIPFSDPIADGKSIQNSSQIALNNGMTLSLLLSQLKNIRTKVKIPLLLMGYFNPILVYGVEKFLKEISHIGIDGVIIPDFPIIEYKKLEQKFKENNILNIFMISSETPSDRIKTIENISQGFIYVMSSTDVTGSTKYFSQSQISFYKNLDTLNLKQKLALGFGISNPYNFSIAKTHFPITIIGSLFINALLSEPSSEMAIDKVILSINK